MQHEEARAVTSTWDKIVDTTLPAKQRGCVFCGKTNIKNHRAVDIQSVLAITELQSGLQHDSVRQMMQNLAQQTKAVAEIYGCVEETRPHKIKAPYLVSCMCCHHWVARRKQSDKMFPMQALACFLRTLGTPKHSKGRFATDSRVLHRMACVLANAFPETNCFRTCFTQDELITVNVMKHNKSTEAQSICARHFLKINNNPVLVSNVFVAEQLRGIRRVSQNEESETTLQP